MRRRAGISAVVCLLVAITAGAPAMARRTLRYREHFTPLPYTGAYPNGSQTLFYTTVQGQVGVLLDESTGKRTTVWLPDDCPAPDANGPTLGGGWILEDCTSSRVDLYSMAQGTWTDVAIAPACVNFDLGPGSECTVYAVGSDWIAYDTSSARYGDRLIFQSITTGVVRHDPASAATLADLSSPTLVHHVCRPLRVPRGSAMVGLPGGFVLSEGEGPMVLERCGHHLRRAMQFGNGFSFDTWSVSSSHVIVNDSVPGGRLTGVFLPSLQPFSVQSLAPRQFVRQGLETAGGRHIYLLVPPIAPLTKPHLLWAPLPQPPS